jgi:hypothetical protein
MTTNSSISVNPDLCKGLTKHLHQLNSGARRTAGAWLAARFVWNYGELTFMMPSCRLLSMKIPVKGCKKIDRHRCAKHPVGRSKVSQGDARRVLDVLPKRFGKYGLTIHPTKTRLVAFRPPSRSDRTGAGAATQPGCPHPIWQEPGR